MINLKIRGRLGNQLFQFMTVKAYQLKYYPNEEISIDFSDLKKLGSEKDGFSDSLKYFQVLLHSPAIHTAPLQRLHVTFPLPPHLPQLELTVPFPLHLEQGTQVE